MWEDEEEEEEGRMFRSTPYPWPFWLKPLLSPVLLFCLTWETRVLKQKEKHLGISVVAELGLRDPLKPIAH